MRRPTAALLFAVLIGVACDSKADEHVSLTPAPAQSLELAFEATRALALSDHAADAFTVVERYNWEVSRMRLDGSVTASWGRQGQGPGEFKAVTDAVTAEDGATWIFDTSRLAAMAFDSAGAFLDEVRVNGLPVALRGTERGFAGIFFTNPGLAHVSVSQPSDDPTVIPLELRDPQSEQEPLPAVSGGAWLSDTERVLASGGSGRLFLVDLEKPRILEFGRGLERRYPTEEDTEANRRLMAATYRTAGREISEAELDLLISQLQLQLMPVYRASASDVDRKGRFWIASAQNEDGKTRMDVFLRDGEFAGEVWLRGTIQAVRFDSNRLWAVSSEESGVTNIDVYDLNGLPLGTGGAADEDADAA